MLGSRSPINALHWIGAVAAFAATIYYWDGFSGPFRWLIDLQIKLTGRFYWEPLAVAGLLAALLCMVVLVAGLLDPIVPRFKARTWGWLFVAVALLASVGALAHAWRIWTAPPGPTRQVPPLRVLDLDQLATADLPFGPVRILGRADRGDQVKLHREPRGYHVYQPLGGRRRAADAMPVSVVAVCYSRYRADCMPEALEGWLSPGGYDDRDSYRLRRAGVLTGAPFYMLNPGLPTYETYREASDRDPGGAVAVVLGVIAFWGVVIFSWIKTPPDPAPRSAPTVVDDRAATPQASPPEANLYLFAVVVSAFIFVLLSSLGIIRGVIQLFP